MKEFKASQMQQHALNEGQFADTYLEKSEESEELVLKENYLEIAGNMNAAKIAKIKESNVGLSKEEKTKLFDDAYAKATKTERDKYESKIRSAIGVKDESLKGDALFEEFKKKTGENAPTLDQNFNWKTSQEFLNLEKGWNDRLTKAEETAKEKYGNALLKLKIKETGNTVLSRAQKKLTGYDPILSPRKEVRDSQLEAFDNKIKKYDYELGGDIEYLVHKHDDPNGKFTKGSRVEDSQGNHITVDKYIEQSCMNSFDFKVQKPAASAQNVSKPFSGGGGEEVDVNKPNEVLAISDPDARKEALKKVADNLKVKQS